MRYVISYKTSSVHSTDVYVTAKNAQKIASEIADAVWFADKSNCMLKDGENVEDRKTTYNFKNNRFQTVIFDNIELPGFESQCVAFDRRYPHNYKIEWSKVEIYDLVEWFERKQQG